MMKHEVLCYKKDEFNLDIFSQDIHNIFISDDYDFQVGLVYYLNVTDINGKILSYPVQIPFRLVSLTCIDELTVDLYTKINKWVNEYDWKWSKDLYLLRDEFNKYSIGEYEELLCIYIDTKKFKSIK